MNSVINMKKIISLLFVVIILIVLSMPSFAANEVMFSASDCEVFAGDEFTVDIFISDNSLLSSATILVQYNEKNLQFLDLSVGYIVEAGEKAVTYKNVKSNNGNSYVQIDYADYSATLTSAGKFLSLTFAANDNAVGKTEIKLVASGGKFTSANGAFTPKFKNGKINIINNTPVTNATSNPANVTENTTVGASETVSTEASSTSSITTSEESLAATEPNTNGNNSKEETDSTDKLIIGVAVITVFAVAIFVIATNNSQKPTKKRKKKKSKR